MWKFKNFSPTMFLQKFRQSNFFTKELYCKLISRKFFEVGVNFRNFHTVQKNHEISTLWNVNKYLFVFQATSLRMNAHYIRWYSCIINSIGMIVVPTVVLIFTTYKVTKLLNITNAATSLLNDERSKARLKRNQSITRMLIGIILMFLICHTGKVNISPNQYLQ